MKYKLVDITDLPADPMGSMGKLRTELVRVYNNSRTNFKEHRMRLLENTLQRILIEIQKGKPEQLTLPYLPEEKQEQLETLISFPKEDKPETKRSNAKRNKQENN